MDGSWISDSPVEAAKMNHVSESQRSPRLSGEP